MADGTDGFATRFLQRTDGSLLTLNLATLTLVSGLEKFGGGELARFVNLQVLVGGLCVGLFFAILCAYYTAFGVRAAAAPARRLKGRPFEEELSLPGIDSGRGLMRLGAWFAACLAPVLLLATVMHLGDVHAEEALQRVVVSEARLNTTCRPLLGQALSHTAPITLGDRPLGLELKRLKISCKVLEKALRESSEKLAVAKKLRSVWWNTTFIVVVLMYLVSPFAAWWIGGRFASIRPRQSLSARRRRELHARVDCIQGLRLAVALLSFAAFVLGVGLALVNTGVAKISAGLADSPPPLPSATDRSAGVDRYASLASQGGSGGQGGLGGTAQGGSAALTIPNSVDVRLSIPSDARWPQQTVTIEGLEKMPTPSPPAAPQFNLPDAIRLNGFPTPSENSIFVQSAPTPPPLPPPTTAEEIAQALEARAMVKVCEGRRWWGLVKTDCSFRLQPTPTPAQTNAPSP
jgi:hypothetical protein